MESSRIFKDIRVQSNVPFLVKSKSYVSVEYNDNRTVAHCSIDREYISCIKGLKDE